MVVLPDPPSEGFLASNQQISLNLTTRKRKIPDHGLWLLHGHVHEKWKSKGKMINVGVDVWDFYPVPITTVESLIREASP